MTMDIKEVTKTEDKTREELLDEVQATAELYFERGELFCSESVVKTINDLLRKPYSDNVVKLASGFPIGIGKAQCLCGAVSGAEIALGMVYGRNYGEDMGSRMFETARKIHDKTKDIYRSTCCRVITKEWQGDDFKSEGRRQHCIEITGKLARWTVEEFLDDGVIKVRDI